MFEFALWIISLIVYCLLMNKKNAWGWIVLYWAVLFIKNAFDFGGVI